MNMKLFTGCGLFFFVLAAFTTPGKADVEKEMEAMKQADIAFSKLSEQKGMRTAFLHYLDSNGVLLRPDHHPITGKEAFHFLQNINDSSFTLTWAPERGEVALSGDLGYTYGLYTYTTKDTTLQGTYVSVWKKQKDGSWKYVLDSGNPGVGKK